MHAPVGLALEAWQLQGPCPLPLPPHALPQMRCQAPPLPGSPQPPPAQQCAPQAGAPPHPWERGGDQGDQEGEAQEGGT